MTQTFLRFVRARLHLDQAQAGVPAFHREGEAMAEFATPMNYSPVLSAARQNIAVLCPDLVHEAERGLGRHL